VEGFNNFIETTEFLDVPLIGGKYTWYMDNETAKSRIDKILISSEWLEYWQIANNMSWIGKYSIIGHYCSNQS